MSLHVYWWNLTEGSVQRGVVLVSVSQQQKIGIGFRFVSIRTIEARLQ